LKHSFLRPLPRAVIGLSMALTMSQAFALPMEGNTPNVLSFGFGNNPVGAIDRLADMPVGYRYQYFTGGLGAGDWRNWSVPDGSFADQWLNESREAGLVPVITYYEIVHAEPNPGGDPPLQNLQVPETMKSYFENWIFLLQRIAAFGDPVVVHLEPDLFGNIEWSNGDPALTPVAVASSGFPQAAGYENNARGFAKLMVALRDQYAPKVILGWHASAWATRTDLILNQGDPDKVALETANFYRALGAPFDVMFAEFSDRDSGYYQIQGQAQRWWKPEDFDRYRQFIGRLSNELDQEVIMWQIPLGNTLYRSSNNTVGHYQDNRPEYLLQSVLDNGDTSHLQQFRDAGVVAFLFGAGQDDQSKYFDARNDGVTNPDPIDNRQSNHTDHLNDRMALNADDDGGFLRHAVKRYYTDGALPISRAPAACNDGLDNDNDGVIDYPADSGCSSITDNDETVQPALCADGKDNDNDGLTDYPNDPGCTAADDNNEYNPPAPTDLPADVKISSDWTSGYCADVSVTNDTSATVEWQTSFSVQGLVNSFWNALHSQQDQLVTATGENWNKVLSPGASASFGFCAERPQPKPICSDGIDNDNDGKVDYPADTGCTSATDSDETDAQPGSLQTQLSITGDWGSGYCANVTVKNTGAGAQIWQVDIAIEGKVNALWNAVYSQNGATLSASGMNWNKSVAAGQSQEFGFCATR
jgi:hypothetical protein